MLWSSAPSVSGPVATMAGGSGSVSASASTTVIFGWFRIRSVTRRAKPCRSTASAPPAGTRVSSAEDTISEPMRRISSFKSPAPFCSRSERREFEQTSSPKRSVLCAGERRSGRISTSETAMPRSAS